MGDDKRTFAVIGLGNPGPEYQETRHNAGFWLLDAWTSKHKEQVSGASWTDAKTCVHLRLRLSAAEILLVKPLRFMNRSGEAVLPILRFFKIPLSQTVVAYDDLDLSPGIARLKRGGSSGGHRGLADFVRVAGADDFIRLRIGIGHPRQAAAKGAQNPAVMDVHNWVLGRPDKAERARIAEAIVHGVDAVDRWIAEGFAAAQQKLHSVSKAPVAPRAGE